MTVNVARELSVQAVHQVAKKFTFADAGAGALEVGQVPASIVTNVIIAKTADFNAGSTSTIDIGIDQLDGTTEDHADALVDGYDLSSTTGLGPLKPSLVDNADFEISNPAKITATLATTGTAADAGEAYVVVEYIPLSHVND